MVLRFSSRLNIPTVFAANRPIPWDKSKEGLVRMEICDKTEGSADDRIVELAEPGDLVLTRDLPLAERLVERDIKVLDDRGRIFTGENIKQLRSLRDFNVALAENGLDYTRTAGYGKKEVQALAQSLDRELTILLKY